MQPYIDRIELPGFLLHSLKKKETLFEYLESINKSGDRNARVYDEEVLIELTKYIFAAKAYFMTRPLSDEEIKLTEKLDLNNSRSLGRGKKKENIFMGIAKGKAKSESKTEVVAEVTVTRVELLSPREFRERQLEVYKQSMVDRHNSKLTLKASRVRNPPSPSPCRSVLLSMFAPWQADLQPHLAQAGQSTLLRYPLAFRTRA